MIRSFKALSALLAYPGEDMQAATDEIRQALLADNLVPPAMVAALDPLLDSLAKDDIYMVQERYVMLFDRSRTLSLNLFEHIHGESRDRGSAMVDLLETYRGAGFEPASSELPDHLPMLLEFLATRSFAEAQDILADTAHILEALKVRLVRRESFYAPVFDLLVCMADVKPDADILQDLLDEEEEDPNDLEALDRVWEESAITFGPDPNAGCPVSRSLLAQMDMPVNTPPAHAAAQK